MRGRYDIYGNPMGAPNPEEVKHEFTGHETELNSGLVYAGARFLDPVTATFLTQDPAAEFLNPYTYTAWDPVNLTDPTGEFLVSSLVPLILKAVLVGFVFSFARA